MVNSLLFRWEDSQALQHHCGFCERPLSHPGARASCFGTHSEPCHRFHQAMFMRNRAHVCYYCSTIDEAHYKRHHELVTQLRSIYESCGEVNWTILPAEPGDSRRDRSSETHPSTSITVADSPAPEETPTSRRERKNAKCLARAANRARVVTQEEIRYMDSVLHSAGCVAGAEDSSPANLEEVQLIEEHLRYNANVYNNHSSRRDLRIFAKIPDVDVDFEGEMERVLDTLHITELVKRNFRNRGLQGKELKSFEILVESFRNIVVEDLVLVKKDMMEIRMRRAGYLRYTNKTAYGIVEERYADKDWKTGERITSSCSESSGRTSLSEDIPAPLESSGPEVSPSPTYSTPTGPDRRHLQYVHTRISGDDGLGQKVIEPYHTPLLPLTPNTPLKKPAILQLRINEDKENGIAGMTDRGWLHRTMVRQNSVQPLHTDEETQNDSPLFVKSAVRTEARSTMKPVSNGNKVSTEHPVAVTSRVDTEEFPTPGPCLITTASASIRSDALAVQPPTSIENTGLKGPECLLPLEQNAYGTHPVVSQKKAKKAQREAKRKAKKSSKPEETSSPTSMTTVCDGFAEQASDIDVPGSPIARTACYGMKELSPQKNVLPSRGLTSTQASKPIKAAVNHKADTVAVVASSNPSTPRTTHGKHDQWTRFARAFAVDQLTIPLLRSFEDCSHDSSCLFESNKLLDCPFHEPHCSCIDPLLHQYHLIYPGKVLCTSGPYNQIQGERLLSLYQQHDLTKGRVMLVDDDLVSYLMDINSSPANPDLTGTPIRLLQEHSEFLDGYGRGPLMKQELEFERLLAKNMSTKHVLAASTLQDIQCQNSGPKGSVHLCYCRVEVLPTISEIKKEFSKGFVSCSYRKCEFGGTFHKRCVETLGVEKVSRWYCTSCEKQMRVLACETLRVPYMDTALIDAVARHLAGRQSMGKAAPAVFVSSLAALKCAKSSPQESHVGNRQGDLEVEDVD